MKRILHCVIIICVIFSVINSVATAQETEEMDTAAMTTADTSTATGFWGKTWQGIKTGGAYTWSGIKWGGKKVGKGLYYMKEGAISFYDQFAQSVGLRERESELEFTEHLIRQSNKTLAESQTKRAIRMERNAALERRLEKLQ